LTGVSSFFLFFITYFTLVLGLIQQNLPQAERLKLLNNTAIQQMLLLTEDSRIKKLEGKKKMNHEKHEKFLPILTVSNLRRLRRRC